MPVDEEGREYFTSGSGWLDKNEAYLSYFHDATVHNAIYTHSYNPSKTKIFVGGGPLMVSCNPHLSHSTTSDELDRKLWGSLGMNCCAIKMSL